MNLPRLAHGPRIRRIGVLIAAEDHLILIDEIGEPFVSREIHVAAPSARVVPMERLPELDPQQDRPDAEQENRWLPALAAPTAAGQGWMDDTGVGR